MSPEASSCPRCGARLPSRAVGGLCPVCLIRVSLRPLTETTSTPPRLVETPPPARLGDFELLEEIGRGGMGVVWRARQMSLNRLVALKTLRADVLGDDLVRQRIRAEAEAAATLSHPNIVPVFEVGETAGHAWFAMQLVEGGTLADHLADGLWSARHCPANRQPRVPWPCRARCCPRGAALVVKLARAVHHAHQLGILHRDLKPGNILLDETGQPHITDFGLARWLDVRGSGGRANEVAGTPSYMAPEQAGGDAPVTTAADIYSLGAILYHILTGRPPFMAETPAATLRKVREELPPWPRTLNPDVDRDLEAICVKCLAKDPAERYASAASLADDLDRWSRAENIRARKSGPWERACRWTRRKPAVAGLSALALLLLAAGALGVLTQWFRAERHAVAAQVAARRAGQQLTDMLVANGVRLVEAGDLLGALPWYAEAARLQPTNELHRLRLASTLRAAPALEHAWDLKAPVRAAAWSPDGRRIAAGADNGQVLVARWDSEAGNLTGGELATRFSVPAGVHRLAFAPDGVRTALGGGDGRVWLFQGPGLNLRELAGPAAGAVRALVFSPDGRQLAAGGADRQVRLWTLPAAGQPQLLAHEEVVTDLAFSPDSARLVSTDLGGAANFWHAADGTREGAAIRSSEGLFGAGYSPDGSRLVTAGAEAGARLWTTGPRRMQGARMGHLSWINWAGFSPDGRFVATCSEDTTARLWDGNDGHPLTPPLRHEGRVTCASFDRQGRRLATGGSDQAVRVWSVPDGSMRGAPLLHGGAVTAVAWQPTGGLLLTTSADGLVRLWNPEPNLASTGLAGGFTPWNAWFAPGEERFIASGPGGRVRVFQTSSAEPASPLFPHPALVDHAALSPDGGRLLTACRDTWARVWDVTNGFEIAAAKLTNAVIGIAWRPDGQSFAALADEPAVHLFDAATGRALARLAAEGANLNRAAFSPDGRMLVASDREGTVWRWGLESGGAPRLLIRTRLHGGLITSLHFSARGETLITAGTDGLARLVNPHTGQAKGVPMIHTDAVVDARFDAAGQRVVTASDDGTARIWDAATGQPLGPPLRPQGGVRVAGFSGDGRLVLTRNADAVQVWDAATGKLVLPRFAPPKPVAGAGFSPEVRRLWVVSEQPRLYPLELTPGAGTGDDWQFAARLLSCREVDATGSLVAWSSRQSSSRPASVNEIEARWARLRSTLDLPASRGTDQVGGGGELR